MTTSESDDQGAEAEDPEQELADRAAELVDRLQADEKLDLEAYARELPEPLRALLPAIARMAGLKRKSALSGVLEGCPGAFGGPEPVAFDDFRILREVGRGGMGVVYEAVQLSLDRRVAIKVLPRSAESDSRRLQRFQLEARALASLNHPGIVPIYSIGHVRGTPYFAMQLIDGRTLAEVTHELRALRGLEAEGSVTVSETTHSLASGWSAWETTGGATLVDRVNPTETAPSRPGGADAPPTTTSPRAVSYPHTVAGLGLQAAEALAHAHELGVIHRDIKPGNLLVDARGHLWITDFGMVRLQGESDLTRTGDLLGTLKYMSPEQALGRRELVDERTDVYSLGTTLYELLSLRPAFDGEDRHELLRRITQEAPVALRAIDPSIPIDLETLVTKAMAREPAGRYATARALADDLRRFLAHEPIRARPAGRIERFRRWCERPERVREAGLALLSLGFLTSGIGLLFYMGYLIGLVKPKRAGDFTLDLVVAFLAFDGPPLWCGVKTLAGSRNGLRLGLLTSLNFLIWLLIGLSGWNVLDYGGVYEDRTAAAPLVLLLLLLVAHTVVRTSIGLWADRMNPGVRTPVQGHAQSRPGE